jgi:hypothetical protein
VLLLVVVIIEEDKEIDKYMKCKVS